MKKILLSSAAVALLFASSCKKDDDKGGGGNSWSVKGTSYGASTVTRNASAKTLTATNGTNSITLYFDALPTANGTVKIGDNTNELTIAAAGMNGATTYGYFNKSVTNVNATVTMNNGKISVSAPEFWAEDIMTDDSVKISFNITEN